MADGVKDIKNVTVVEEELNLKYEVTAKGFCEGDCVLCISNENSTDETKRLPSKCVWNGALGTLTVEKNNVEQGPELYLYIFDKSTGISSSIVRVYSERAELNRWELSGNGELILYVKKDCPIFPLSDKVMMAYMDRYGKERTCYMQLPSTRIRLDEIDVTPEDKSFAFSICYHMKDAGAEIFSASTEVIEVYPACPAITAASYTDGCIEVQLKEKPDKATVEVELIEDGVTLLKTDLTDGRMNVGDVVWNRDAVYSIRACYRNDKGKSEVSDNVVVEVRMPEIVACEFRNGTAVLKLAQRAVYQYGYDNVNETVCGDSISVPETVRAVSVAMKRGLSTGPVAGYELKNNAFYAIRTENGRVFYFYGERPDGMAAGQDVTVTLDTMTEPWTDYDGTCFALKKGEEGKPVLTVKAAYYTVGAEEMESDFLAMTEKLLSDEYTDQKDSLLNEIRTRLIDTVPVEAGEHAFFMYGYCPQNGYTGISEGMSLLTEYAVYQNVPDEDEQTCFAEGLSGFAGSGTARYEVVRRNGKLTVDSFAASMNFEVPPPPAMTGDAKLQGGAGMADMLFGNFTNTVMRVVYPAQYLERTSGGEMVYADNVCVITAGNMKELHQATVNMRRRAAWIPNVCYQYFRGKSIIVPQIKIDVNGNAGWFSLGIRLGDVMEQWGMKETDGVRLYRRRNGILYEVLSPCRETVLLIGDRVVI